MVFSDVVMPGMGGIELAPGARAAIPDLPVVLTSGYSHVLAEEAPTASSCCTSPTRPSSSSRILGKLVTRNAGKP